MSKIRATSISRLKHLVGGRLRLSALVLLLVATCLLSTGDGSPTQELTSSSGVPTGTTYNVVTYGADPTGKSDSTIAIRAALTAAQAASTRGTLYFPSGTFLLDHDDGTAADFRITGPTGPNVLGAGRDSTKLIERVGSVTYPTAKPKTVFVLTQISGLTFGGLTVDAQTFNAGDAIDDFGDYTTIHHSTFLGAQNSNTFTMRVIAVCNQDPASPLYNRYHTGNVVDDIILNGRGIGGNDDLDFSCERNGTISNIQDTGWGTALYIDQNVTISHYTFTPGTAEKNPRGWYITDSSYITVSDFTTSGQGGIIDSPNYPSSHITISHEVMTAPGYRLTIDDSSDTVIKAQSVLTGLYISPTRATQDLTVGEQSQVGTVTCKPHAGATITGLQGVSCP